MPSHFLAPPLCYMQEAAAKAPIILGARKRHAVNYNDAQALVRLSDASDSSSDEAPRGNKVGERGQPHDRLQGQVP